MCISSWKGRQLQNIYCEDCLRLAAGILCPDIKDASHLATCATVTYKKRIKQNPKLIGGWNKIFERKEEIQEHRIYGRKLWALKYLEHSGDRTSVSGNIKIEQKVWE